jgi:hypothetical protein
MCCVVKFLQLLLLLYCGADNNNSRTILILKLYLKKLKIHPAEILGKPSTVYFTINSSKLSWLKKFGEQKILGLVRELNPGPRAPEARIIPLDQRASYDNYDMNSNI